VQIDSTQQAAFRRFADAVHAFSREPDRANFMRYVTASQALEESKRRLAAQRTRRSRKSQ
jgi:hypothetical protein